MSERTLDRSDLDADPISTFDRWFAEAVAAGEPEPEAMALATASPDGSPTVRFVLLKAWDEGGFTFYTNAGSDKGADLRSNPRAALALRWALLDRQVRVTGPVAPVEASTSDAYFASRARRSQLGAWASEQSRPIPDRAALERRLAEVEDRYLGVDVPRPAHWHGWRVSPATVEFWQGRDNRLHDRLRCSATAGGGWEVTRLSP